MRYHLALELSYLAQQLLQLAIVLFEMKCQVLHSILHGSVVLQEYRH